MKDPEEKAGVFDVSLRPTCPLLSGQRITQLMRSPGGSFAARPAVTEFVSPRGDIPHSAAIYGNFLYYIF